MNLGFDLPEFAVYILTQYGVGAFLSTVRILATNIYILGSIFHLPYYCVLHILSNKSIQATATEPPLAGDGSCNHLTSSAKTTLLNMIWNFCHSRLTFRLLSISKYVTRFYHAFVDLDSPILSIVPLFP